MPATDHFDDPVFEIRYSLRRVADETARIRRAMLALVESGVLSQRELAAHVGVSHTTIARWLREARTERDAASPLP